MEQKVKAPRKLDAIILLAHTQCRIVQSTALQKTCQQETKLDCGRANAKRIVSRMAVTFCWMYVEEATLNINEVAIYWYICLVFITLPGSIHCNNNRQMNMSM